MSNKILIIGGVAGGASTAARLRRMDEDAEIIMFERGEYISFANCGLPYYIGGTIEERDKLLVQTPDKMGARFNIDIKVKNEVIDINPSEQEIKVKDLSNDEEYVEDYDYLVLSPGAEPIKPSIPGIENERIFTLRNIPDTDAIKKYLDDKNPEKAVVIGGGFIGLEMVENLHDQGLDVSLVEAADQVMGPIDYEMASILHNHMRQKEVKLYLEDGVKAFEDNDNMTDVILESGKELEADMIIMAIGVKPSVELAKKAGLELGETGAILVDEYMKTSEENIYALGDAVEVKDYVTGNKTHIPLAGPANKQGRIVANNLTGRKDKFTGTQGSSVAKIFDLTVASTGKNEKSLEQEGIDYEVSFTMSKSHAGYYPGAIPMTVKILFKPEDGEVLGAQIVGRDGVDKRIDVLATALRFKKTVFDLQELELAYAPPYSSAKDPVNMAGFTAGNILNGEMDIIHWSEIDELDENNTFLLDIRTEVENDLGAIDGSTNIPLNDLRDRLNEIPKDKEIIVYCQVGLRGYIATRILLQNGFKDIRNLSGGYRLYKQVQKDKEFRKDDPSNVTGSASGSATKGKESQQKNEHVERGKDELIARENGDIETDETGEPLGDVETFKVDACGLQCPGPIMQVYRKMEELDPGDILEASATDPAFSADIESWCESTGNTLLKLDTEGNKFIAFIKKGGEAGEKNEVAESLGKAVGDNKTMVVFSDDLDRVLASFIIANGAASMGKEVTMFFTFWGLNVLRKDEYVDVEKGFMDKMFSSMMPRGSKRLGLSKMNMMGMGRKMMRKVMENKNVDSLEALIGQAKLSGVNLVACQMSMDVLGIKKEELIDGVDLGGVATYLNEAEGSNMNLFI
ncbi:CoA-disulfide reductase [Selenihalanaerobacter shriftii]|uniref:CoA-disulfide reductase n=1 Tax=Selenihalanaerobacter shriftii TaxID=142842 RepID=A0A1T4JS76_9FIRM|nr:CoA-disulfide reductase [Selenihalanaerobacter shriftii]SJZ32993.1 CoA-disulfide reductase [Selenihalanaerobacter shriftii]